MTPLNKERGQHDIPLLTFVTIIALVASPSTANPSQQTENKNEIEIPFSLPVTVVTLIVPSHRPLTNPDQQTKKTKPTFPF